MECSLRDSNKNVLVTGEGHIGYEIGMFTIAVYQSMAASIPNLAHKLDIGLEIGVSKAAAPTFIIPISSPVAIKLVFKRIILLTGELRSSAKSRAYHILPDQQYVFIFQRTHGLLGACVICFQFQHQAYGLSGLEIYCTKLRYI